jgi:hypothetical protein
MKMVDQDGEHLRLLSILYYIWGGLAACGSCFTIIYAVVMGAVFTAAGQTANGPPPWLGGVLFVILSIVFVLVFALAALTIWTGFNLSRRRHYVLCMVVAAINCLSFPLGTALGVFTIVVLGRPSVKPLFGHKAITNA